MIKGVRVLNGILLWVFAAVSVAGQQVNYDYLGIQFQVPDGWVGQENGESYMMGSNTEVGFIMITTHAYQSLEQLRAEAQQGLSDDGTMLQPSGRLESIGQQGVGVEMTGFMSGQQAKAYVAGLINPHGAGVTIIGLTSQQAYSDRHRQLVHQVASSVRFSQAKQSPMVVQAQQALAGMLLTYMDSYHSSDINGGYVGSSSKREIQLCRNGQFTDNSNSSMSIDTGSAGAGGYGGSQGGGQGRWSVTQDGHGNPALELHYANGEVGYYEIGFQNGKTYLNGTRFFRTEGGC